MRLILKIAFSMAVVVGVVNSATAQGSRPLGGGMVYFLPGQLKPLRDELKIDDEQAEKLRAATKPINDKRLALLKGFDPRTVSEVEMKSLQEKTAQLADEAKAAVQNVLKPEQFKRLQQIEYQSSGARAFLDKELQAGLKMSNAQKEAVKKIVDELAKGHNDLQQKMLEGLQVGTRDDQRKVMQEIRNKRTALDNDATESILKVLADEQKSALKEMLGVKFDLVGITPKGSK